MKRIIIIASGLLFGASMPIFAVVAAIQWVFYDQVDWSMCAYIAIFAGLLALWITRGVSEDKGQAKTLCKLSAKTIKMMENLLSDLETDDPNRFLIEDHLHQRIKQRERFSKLASGESDMLEKLSPTMRHYEIHKRSMELELRKFGVNAETFVWYLKQNKKRF